MSEFKPTYLKPRHVRELRGIRNDDEFIEESDLTEDVVEDIFCNSSLEWLNMKKEDLL